MIFMCHFVPVSKKSRNAWFQDAKKYSRPAGSTKTADGKSCCVQGKLEHYIILRELVCVNYYVCWLRIWLMREQWAWGGIDHGTTRSVCNLIQYNL